MIKIGSYSRERNEFKDGELVCYCFGYTRKDIEKDYVDNNGQSTILESIALETNAGQCDCAQKNPKGR
ncbi:MAG: (2Fe-2S)-binding protein [Syntrophales bacterium]|nr:(2Fe-2S)-binding protein [Syntrophales bacterium]